MAHRGARFVDNVKRGRRTERIRRLRGRNKPLKGEAQGRYRRETEPERFREERSAKRLKKPEGAAQPGEASPVQVASRCFIRRRAANLMRGVCFGSGSPWVILCSGAQVHERTGWRFTRQTEVLFGKTSRVRRETKAEEGELNQYGSTEKLEIL
jgi:hypothetical protein